MSLTAWGVAGIGEVAAGADLAALIHAAALAGGAPLLDGDIVVVSSKVVSKAEGRFVRGWSRDDAVGSQTVRVVAERATPRGVTRIVESAPGPVLAAAGVDASNVPLGQLLLLPADPDASARSLRCALAALSGVAVGVIVSDTMGRPWREGQTDAAIGCAGVAVVDDLRGVADSSGTPLEVTVRAIADEIAALADLVKGKLDGVPVAVVRGLAGLVTAQEGPGAAALRRPAAADWFRLGHVEAVRASLGVPAGFPPRPERAGPAGERLRRAVEVAAAGADWTGGGVAVSFDSDTAALSGPALALGAFVQRALAAAWAEDLVLAVSGSPPDSVVLTPCS